MRHTQLTHKSPIVALLAGLVLALTACDDSTTSEEPIDMTTSDATDGGADTAADTTGADDTGDVTGDAADTSTGDTEDDAADTAPDDTTAGDQSELGDQRDQSDVPMCATELCDGVCCETNERCVRDLCLIDGGACTDSGDCTNDTFCDADGRCSPYGLATGVTTNPACTRDPEAASFRPRIQCEWNAAPAGDPYPNHVRINGTPTVVDFRIGHDFATNPQPSIVVPTTDAFSYTDHGIIRIFDGRTCELQYTIGTEVASAGTPALADITNDTRPEILAWTASGNPVAFEYNPATDSWDELWQPTVGEPWSATPSVHDLNDDNVPEVIYGGLVVDAGGTVLNPGYSISGLGTYMVPVPVVDIDLDGAVELIRPDGVFEWDATNTEWDLQAGWLAEETRTGFVAVGDFGEFPGAAGDAANRAEVASIIRGEATVRTHLGEIVFGPVAIPGGPDGGNPVVADFDGDGLIEFGAGGPGSYTTFDLDCTDSPRTGGDCASGRTDGILWTTAVRDFSIGINGTSIFDFDGDGRTEVVYADECYLRIFDGIDGSGIYSAMRSSATWLEMPIVADVDGDFNAEIVVGNYPDGSGACPSVDPNHVGVPCLDDANCLSGSCDGGLCRCTDAGGCPDGHACDAPIDGSDAMGNVCRASQESTPITGLRVYQDSADGWVRSRMIWNQYAYFVTNTNELGAVPPASQAMLNWLQPGLNNFRQNVQGTAMPDSAPDLTSRDVGYMCEDPTHATLFVTVCNRGSEPVGTGVRTGFFQTDAGGQIGDPVCIGEPSEVIAPGECVEVSCAWEGSVEGEYDLVVVPDVDGQVSECIDENNRTVLPKVVCNFN